MFDRSIEWATRGDYTDVDIDEAKLSVFQKVKHTIYQCIYKQMIYFFIL